MTGLEGTSIDGHVFGPAHIVLVCAVAVVLAGVGLALGRHRALSAIVAVVGSAAGCWMTLVYWLITVVPHDDVSSGVGLRLAGIASAVAFVATVGAMDGHVRLGRRHRTR